MPESELASYFNTVQTQEEDKWDDDDLLEYYTPVYILEEATAPTYAPSIDRFGAIWMDGTNSQDATPQVNTEQPTVYAYIEYAEQGEETFRQLVCTRWYSEHPKLRSYDPEAGHMDGWPRHKQEKLLEDIPRKKT